MKKGRIGTMAHDEKRNGTCAAFDQAVVARLIMAAAVAAQPPRQAGSFR